MEGKGKSERMIQDVLGCGPFQVVLTISVFLFCKTSATFNFLFLAYGHYNPGWRCLDRNDTGVVSILIANDSSGSGGVGLYNNTRTASTMTEGRTDNYYWLNATINESRHLETIINTESALDYSKDRSCAAFELCRDVEFNPESSTFVTEWGLICDRAWVASIIISVQMVGVLVGSSISGIMADAFGRRTVLYSSQVFTVIFTAIAAFSVSWQMLATLRFFIGISLSFHATLYYVYAVEFMTKKWRGILAFMPWIPLLGVIYGLMCLMLRDWRHIHIATAVISAVGLLSVFLLPESLRWLEVKNRTGEFEKAVKRIAKINCKSLKYIEEPKPDLQEETLVKAEGRNNGKGNIFRDTLHLFGRQYRKFTILVTIPCFSMGLVWYALGFGIKALSGNFYVNLILFYTVELFLGCGAMFAPNFFGRRKSGILFAGFSGLCLLSAACMHLLLSSELSRTIGVSGFVMAGSMSMNGFWCLMCLILSELYPTVIRGVATSWGSISTRIGGILAPVLIPNDSSRFFECYVVMAVLAVVCAVTVSFLPETKGTTLGETFKSDNELELRISKEPAVVGDGTSV